jgi:hypothetical protein
MLRVRVPRHLWHRLLDSAKAEGIGISELVRQGIDDRTALKLSPRASSGQKVEERSARNAG